MKAPADLCYRESKLTKKEAEEAILKAARRYGKHLRGAATDIQNGGMAIAGMCDAKLELLQSVMDLAWIEGKESVS